MRKYSKVKIIFLFMSLILLVNFCSKETQMDPITEFNNEMLNWVKKNKALINDMSRYDLINLPYYQYKYAYSEMTPEKKYELWQNKLFEEIKLRTNQDEVNHIFILSQSFEPEVFIDEQACRDFLEYCELWMAEGMEKFNWQLVDIGLITMTLYPSVNFEEYRQKAIESKNKTLKTVTYIPPDCECLWGWWCTCDEGSSCLGGITGCGFLGLQYCDWLCEGQ